MKTLDQTTHAAIPGGLKVSRLKYARYFGLDIAAAKSLFACSYLPWMMRRVPLIGPQIVLWHKAQEHFRHGCLNPGIVVDRSENLIAVFTSLTASGDEPFPVIRIVKERLDLIGGRDVENGSRFAAPSVYFGTEESRRDGYWVNFHPIVAECLVRDLSSCEEALARIKPAAWEALEIGLGALDRIEEGLYPVDVPSAIVHDAY